MMDNSKFDKMAEELGAADQLAKIHQLGVEPDNGVIATPNGRIFVEVKPFVIDNTILLMLQRGAAESKGDTKAMDHIDGRLMVMKQLLDVHDFMNTRAGIERAEAEANGLDGQ